MIIGVRLDLALQIEPALKRLAKPGKVQMESDPNYRLQAVAVSLCVRSSVRVDFEISSRWRVEQQPPLEQDTNGRNGHKRKRPRTTVF